MIIQRSTELSHKLLLGIQVSIFGTVPELSNSYNMTATSSYILDDLAPINFTAPIYNADQYHQNFYTSPIVVAGQHTVTVTSISVSSDAVFWFDYLEYLSPSNATSTAQAQTISTSSSLTSSTLATVATSSTLSTPFPSTDGGSGQSVHSHGDSKLSTILPATLVPSFLFLLVLTLLVCVAHRRKEEKVSTYAAPPDAFTEYPMHSSAPRRRKCKKKNRCTPSVMF